MQMEDNEAKKLLYFRFWLYIGYKEFSCICRSSAIISLMFHYILIVAMSKFFF